MSIWMTDVTVCMKKEEGINGSVYLAWLLRWLSWACSH